MSEPRYWVEEDEHGNPTMYLRGFGWVYAGIDVEALEDVANLNGMTDEMRAAIERFKAQACPP